MSDAWRAYLEMALGLTEAPRKKAQKVAGDLVNRGGATAVQVQGLVEDLMSTGMANREALTNIVRYEVDRALGVVGLATADEVADLTTRVRELEKQLREARAAVAGSGDPVARAAVGAAGGVGGDRLNKPAPLPAKTAKKAAKKAAKATPNAMPAAGTGPAPVTAGSASSASGSGAPASAAAGAPASSVSGPGATSGPASTAAPATVAKKAVAKKAVAKKAVAKKAGPVKKAAGTSVAPVADVTEAAAVTELPPSPSPAAAKATKKAVKKAPAKKATPGTTFPEA